MNGLAPPELRELLGLLAQLGKFLPLPADGNWDRRADVQRGREILLCSRLDQLEIQLQAGDKYPTVGGEMLAEHCMRSAEVIRAKLAEPLGYEPEMAAARMSSE